MTERNCPACWLISRMCRLRTRWPTSRSRGLRRWMPQGQRRGAAELISMPKAMKDSAPRGPRSASDDVRCRSPVFGSLPQSGGSLPQSPVVCLYCSLTSCTTNLCLSDVPASTHSSNLMKAPVIGCGGFNRPPTALAPDGWLGPVSVSSGTVTRLREPEDLDAGCGKELQAEAQHETGSCN